MRYVCRLLIAFSIFFFLSAITACNTGDDGSEEIECIADSECEDSYCLDRECVECHDDGHCPDGVCEDHQCVDDSANQLNQGECSSDLDCGTDYCVDGECVECDGDEHCEDGGHCSDNQCVECTDDEHCEDGGHCSDNQCVECTDDEHCENGGHCSDNQCVECTDDEHCAIDEMCDENACVDDPACEEDDWPDPIDFEDTNCDGVDGNASLAIFVSTDGDDANGGTPEEPVRTITRGIELATALSSTDRRELYIADGVYHERLDFNESISLYGGYHDTGNAHWDRGTEYETVIAGDQNDELGHRAVEIRGIEDDITLQMLTIEAPDADWEEPESSRYHGGIPGTSVGLVLSDNDGHVELTHSTIEAGRGDDGRDGQDGEDGGSGRDGDDGHITDGGGARTSAQDCSYDHLLLPNPMDLSPSGTPPAHGGAGGDGGTESSQNLPRSGDNGDPTGHESDPILEGGSGGIASTDDECWSGDSHDGSDGFDGKDGPENWAFDTLYSDGLAYYDSDGNPDDGPPIEPGITLLEDTRSDDTVRFFPRGSIAENHILYHVVVPPFMHPGFPGKSGSGAGGGGAAQYYLSSGDYCTTARGGGGGAGGTGGCGGQGGQFGYWGGASIGILTANTSVSIASTTIDTGEGGIGGDGGEGGEGGQGGEGGEGHSPSGEGYAGGDGGDGFPGGKGGDAPGGQGGASIGIVHYNSDVDTDNVNFDLGNPGSGGMGAGEDNDGYEGILKDMYEVED